MAEEKREALTFPAGYQELLERAVVITAGTALPDGGIQMTPMWFDFDGYGFKFSTTTTRQVYRNLKSRRKISFCVLDEEVPGKYIEIRGHVTDIEVDEGFAFFRKLTERYTGSPDYPFHEEDEVRVVATVEVDRKLCFAPSTTE